MSNRNSKRNASEPAERTEEVDDVELTEIEAGRPANAQPLLNGNIDVIKNVKIRLDVVVGEAELPVSELFGLARDSVVALAKDVTSPVDLMLDGRVVARGNLVAVGDNFGVRITEVAGS